MTSYAEIFELALREIDDSSLAQLSEKELSNELYGWLEGAIIKLPKLKSETSDRDSFGASNIKLLGFTKNLSDVAKGALALGIKRQWLAPQIASTTITWQRYSKKEGYSQKEHLLGLIELDKKTKVEIEKLLRDYTYVDNDYFD